MKIRSFFKPRQSHQNPYVAGSAGRQEWNDRYGNLAQAVRHWRLACLTAMSVGVVFAIIIAKLALAAKVQPFVVETHQGMPYAMKPMQAISEQDQRLVNFVLNQFIVNTKTVVADTDAEKALLGKAYAFAANDTLAFLAQFYKKNDPFALASHSTVAVRIIHAMPTGKNTWQITWDETQSDATTGTALSTTRWIGYFDYALGEVNPKYLNDNPFGFYVTRVSWTPSQTDLSS